MLGLKTRITVTWRKLILIEEIAKAMETEGGGEARGIAHEPGWVMSQAPVSLWQNICHQELKEEWFTLTRGVGWLS